MLLKLYSLGLHGYAVSLFNRFNSAWPSFMGKLDKYLVTPVGKKTTTFRYYVRISFPLSLAIPAQISKINTGDTGEVKTTGCSIVSTVSSLSAALSKLFWPIVGWCRRWVSAFWDVPDSCESSKPRGQFTHASHQSVIQHMLVRHWSRPTDKHVADTARYCKQISR